MKFKLKASLLRRITQKLPLTGSIIRQFLNQYDEIITFPDMPVVVSTKDNLCMFEIRDCREYSQQSLYFLGYYELRETLLFKKLLRPGDTFVDIGANLGYFSVLAAHHVSPSGSIISFEPSSYLSEYLQQNVKNLNNSNLTIMTKLEKLACSDENGYAVMRGTLKRNSGLGSIMPITNKSEDFGSEKVKTTKFDDYYLQSNLDKIRLIKIDVEGAELKVLKGMKNILKQRVVEYIIVEVSDARLQITGNSSAELLTLLRDCGYHLSRIGLFGTKPLKVNETVNFANILAEKSYRHSK
ncbi:FkbM family methyltransferase [Pleurocapsa sp. PCC 7319]|uniref:FkbM family methyltransferase n=1 Tax=Pleurocapsa sp. PCC 7319 TaxID=118161 RepID=UPI00034793C2|nr:FkbM family methyltransferase [Pleurocapsa sp. PCC 7319]